MLIPLVKKIVLTDIVLDIIPPINNEIIEEIFPTIELKLKTLPNSFLLQFSWIIVVRAIA